MILRKVFHFKNKFNSLPEMQIELKTIQDLFLYFQSSGLIAKYGIHKFGVFGSFARQEPFHDIDILIEDEHIDWKKLEAFRVEFQLATGTPLDIMVRAYAEPIILNRALKEIQYG